MRPLHIRRPRATLADAQRFAHDGACRGMRVEDYLSDEDRSRIAEEIDDHLSQVPRDHFPRTGNLEYAILKTHLIVEFAITQFICGSSPVLVKPETLRFSFVEKLEIAVLLGFGFGCPTTIPSAELLNRIRNQVAHRFCFDRRLVDELIRINREDVDVARLTDRQKIACLRRLCFAICGKTAGWVQGIIAATQRT